MYRKSGAEYTSRQYCGRQLLTSNLQRSSASAESTSRQSVSNDQKRGLAADCKLFQNIPLISCLLLSHHQHHERIRQNWWARVWLVYRGRGCRPEFRRHKVNLMGFGIQC
jgi:hypothetical protein